MTTPELLVFTWDGPHSCGITGDYQRARDEAHAAVSQAAPGTAAEVRGGWQLAELPHRLVGRAERTETHVAWTSVVWTAETTTWPGTQDLGRGVPSWMP